LFNGTVLSRHLGVDFAGRRGTPVRAGNRGVVVFAGKLYYSGASIFLDHGVGLVTGYFHLSRTIGAVGDTVRRGQVIGYVGATGRVTGPHLHWVGSYGTVSVDPLDLLTLQSKPSP
jgi:murein DD-endopeptidase MepM/ murein hydrolase activator NlpD